MPFGQHRGEGQADDVGLAQHGLADVGDERLEGAGKPFGLFGGHGHGLVLFCSW
ncbi:hypothetical protein D3C85_1890770 [compost metagenome]